MTRLSTLEREMKRIKSRNRRVETDKAWEESLTRKLLIGVLTYIIIAAFLWSAKIPDPLLNAIIPALAFMLSTLSLEIFKKHWRKRIFKRR
jgi:hypothetical protein